MQKDLLQRAQRYAAVHKAAYEKWDKGEIKKVWQKEEGVVNISYENGQWYHYKEESGQVIWW